MVYASLTNGYVTAISPVCLWLPSSFKLLVNYISSKYLPFVKQHHASSGGHWPSFPNYRLLFVGLLLPFEKIADVID